MNEQNLIGVLAEASVQPEIGNIVQTYWFAILLLPAAYIVVRRGRQKRRARNYRW